MKLKYYLRGLGIGIIVSALLLGTFSAAGNKAKGETADQETEKPTILAELEKGNADDAKEESVEESVVQDLQEALENVTGADQGTASETEITAQEKAAEKEAEKAVKEDKKEENTEKKTEEKQAEKETQKEEAKKDQVVASSKSIIVAVYPGEGSYTISRKLASLGLVESADVYDKFLCQNGYDKRLASGNYEIQEGSTPETIAKILTGTN